ncbi:unnamed protein product [Lactuca virosa]|uniref:Replication factor A C-terminal domain-containing protein n=1 Tax=Lactuca virosa TaxID=75947 RepID=A0AAU9NCL7_9ASTR|nr:unnamed protein product [Lactuca virosa]
MPKRKHASIPSSSSASPDGFLRSSRRKRLISISAMPPFYDCGDCICICEFCGALFWFAERNITHSTLLELGEHPPYLPVCIHIFLHFCTFYHKDFIGVLTKIRNCTKKNGAPFVLLVLTDESGDELAINLWKECTISPEKFNLEQLIPPPATTVVAVTNLKASKNEGTLRHGSSSATHIYANPQIPETTILINRFTGPCRPIQAPSGVPITLDKLTTKSRSELQDKTFAVRGSILEISFKDYWCQVMCPTCKDPIFEKRMHWFCSAHGTVQSPTFLYKLTARVTDNIATITASITDNAARKITGTTPDKIFSEDNRTNRRTMPPIISQLKGSLKNISIQLLKTSPPETIRFLIVDMTDTNSLTPSALPTTSTPPSHMKHITSKDTYGDSSSTPQTSDSRRMLSYETPDDTPPQKVQKQSHN